MISIFAQRRRRQMATESRLTRLSYAPEIAQATVSNLLVVLCSERAAQPVVNTGTLYQ